MDSTSGGNDASNLEMRALGDFGELHRWHDAEEIPFGGHGDPHRFEDEKRLLPLDRSIAVFDHESVPTAAGDAPIVATAGAYPFALTVPGGAQVAAAGVTAVAVLATHRRRGILRRMMEHQLDDIAARGEPVAVLNASESAIYSRFGYGLAQRYQSIEMLAAKTTFNDAGNRLADTRSTMLRYVAQAEAAAVVDPMFDAYARSRPGEVSRSADWWITALGPHECWKGGGKLFVVVCHPDKTTGDPGGFVIFTIKYTEPYDRFRVVIRELIAVTTATEAALWRFVLAVDLVDVVEARAVPTDCPVRHWLVDSRQVRTTRDQDYLWVRILDVPTALTARRYAAVGELVIDVMDPFRRHGCAAGRFRLTVTDLGTGDDAGRGDGVASVDRLGAVDGRASITLGVDQLGAIYLGGVRPDALLRAGLIHEHDAGAVALLTAMFVTDRPPMCNTLF